MNEFKIKTDLLYGVHQGHQHRFCMVSLFIFLNFFSGSALLKNDSGFLALISGERVCDNVVFLSCSVVRTFTCILKSKILEQYSNNKIYLLRLNFGFNNIRILQYLKQKYHVPRNPDVPVQLH